MNKSIYFLWILVICLVLIVLFQFFMTQKLVAEVNHINRTPTIHIEHAIITPDVGDLIIEEIGG